MRVQKVQKVQKVQRVVVGGSVAIMNKTFATALAVEGKPYNRACGPSEMHPYSPPGEVP